MVIFHSYFSLQEGTEEGWMGIEDFNELWMDIFMEACNISTKLVDFP